MNEENDRKLEKRVRYWSDIGLAVFWIGWITFGVTLYIMKYGV